VPVQIDHDVVRRHGDGGEEPKPIAVLLLVNLGVHWREVILGAWLKLDILRQSVGARLRDDVCALTEVIPFKVDHSIWHLPTLLVLLLLALREPLASVLHLLLWIAIRICILEECFCVLDE